MARNNPGYTGCPERLEVQAPRGSPVYGNRTAAAIVDQKFHQAEGNPFKSCTEKWSEVSVCKGRNRRNRHFCCIGDFRRKEPLYSKLVARMRALQRATLSSLWELLICCTSNSGIAVHCEEYIFEEAHSSRVDANTEIRRHYGRVTRKTWKCRRCLELLRQWEFALFLCGDLFQDKLSLPKSSSVMILSAPRYFPCLYIDFVDSLQCFTDNE